MGIGASKDEKIHFNDVVIKAKYLQPLKNINTRSGDVQSVRQQVINAKLKSDDYVQALGDISNKLQRELEIISAKQVGVKGLLEVAKKSQASYRNRAAKMEAVQQSSSNLGLAKNSSAAINAIRSKKI